MEIAAVAIAYLVGSISFPQLIARSRGIDLRQVGSRKLGGSNLWGALGPVAGTLGGSLDALKGAGAVVVAAAAGLSAEVQMACGIAAVIGQMWPALHGFDGGRANATGWGVLLVLHLPAAAIGAIPLAVTSAYRLLVRHRPTRALPLVALLTFPIWSGAVAALGGPPLMVATGLVVFAFVLARRITAGLRDDLATGAPLAGILLDRALYDRSELQKRGAVGL